MSEINEFARDLVKRQVNIYNGNKSKEFDMTQPLSVLICISIIIFSDYIENNQKDSLIKEIFENDKNGAFLIFIKGIYEDKFDKRVQMYKKEKTSTKNENVFLNESYKEIELFFHDLRNAFAHIIETRKSKLNPNKDGDFNNIMISNGRNEIKISRDKITTLINLIYDRI